MLLEGRRSVTWSDGIEMQNGVELDTLSPHELSIVMNEGDAQTLIAKKEIQSDHTLTGLLWIALSALVTSIMSTLISDVSKRGIPPFELITVRCVVQFSFVNILLYYNKLSLLGSKENRKWLLLRAMFGYVSISCFYYGVSYLPLSDATVIFFTSPIITGVVASFALGEPFGFINVVITLLSLVGVTFVARPSFIFGDHLDSLTNTPERISGLVAICVGAFSMSFVYVIVRKIGKNEHFLVIVGWFAGLGIPIGAVCALIQGVVMPNSLIQWAEIFGVALCGFFGHLMFNKGMQLAPAVVSATMRNLDVVFAFIFQEVILQEPVNQWSLVGAVIIVGCCTAVAVNKYRIQRKKTRKLTILEQISLQRRESRHLSLTLN